MARGCKTWTGLLGNALFDAIEKEIFLKSGIHGKNKPHFCPPGSKVSIELASAGTDFGLIRPMFFCRCLVSYMDYRQTITSIH